MANTQTKIERIGKAQEVDKILASGTTSASQVHLILTQQGVKISKSAVNSYIKKAIDNVTPEAFKIVSEHIGNVIPNDMEALEAMEAQLLAWSKEAPVDIADRLSEARVNIEREVNTWKYLLTQPLLEEDPVKQQKESNDRVGLIMKQCLGYILMDARVQKKRIEAMTGAIRIIDLKLRHISVLGGSGKGSIIIYDNSSEYDKNPDQQKVIPFSITGGKGQAQEDE